MSFITLYVTHKNMREAKKIVTRLLEHKLIACANYFPITSTYEWKGKLVSATETVTLLKTQKKLWKKVEAAILEIHPYETPCIMKIEVSANEAYESWVVEETTV